MIISKMEVPPVWTTVGSALNPGAEAPGVGAAETGGATTGGETGAATGAALCCSASFAAAEAASLSIIEGPAETVSAISNLPLKAEMLQRSLNGHPPNALQ